MLQKRPDPETNPWQAAGLALSIPMLMVSGPIAGYLIGLGIVWATGLNDPWARRVKYICLIVGVLAGARETIKLIRRLSSEPK
jgi:type IV secretory pathway VirB2 component (pilin)